MNEEHFAYKIRQHLNRGAQELAPATLARLELARQQALGRQKVAQPQSVLAAAGSFVLHQVEHFRLKHVLLALLVAAGVAGYAYWSAETHIEELEAIDSALLADDLPIAAFTDRGFAAWLRSSASE